jgi:hypothetical protein
VFVLLGLLSVPETRGQEPFNFVNPETGEATYFLKIDTPPGAPPLEWWVVARANPGFENPLSSPNADEGNGFAIGPCFLLNIIFQTVASGFSWRLTPRLGNTAGGTATGVAWAFEARSDMDRTAAAYIGRGARSADGNITGRAALIRDTADFNNPTLEYRNFVMIPAGPNDTPCQPPMR